MQQYPDQNQPDKPPERVLEFKVQTILALFAMIIAGVSVVMSFTIIGPVLAYVGIVIGLAALVYIAFVLVIDHQDKRESKRIERRRLEALAEREEIRNDQERQRARVLSTLTPDPVGNYPAWLDPAGRVVTITPGNAIQPVPEHYAPHIDYRIAGQPGQLAAPAELPQIAAPLALPGPLSMIEVMRTWELSPEHLFLALGRGGKQIACSVEHFMHVAHDGPTGSGKTTQWKAELVMLLKAEVNCFLANPHFAPVSKKGEDYRPIARALEQQELPGQLPGLLYDPEQIRDFLKWLATVEIDRRFSLMRAGRYEYPPLYGFIDEWAEQVEAYPESARYMKTIIRRGRAVEVCVSTNSQGFLVADTGLNSSARENFQTAYDLGSSPTSTAAMMDMPWKEIKELLSAAQVSTLGQGVALLRNNVVSSPAQVVRLPHADNEYVYYMFGRADDWTLPEYRTVSAVVSDEGDDDELFLEADEDAQDAEPDDADLVSTETSRRDPIAGAAAVSTETKKRIERDIRKGGSFGRIAEKYSMRGGNWPVFQQICKDLGYNTSLRNPYGKGGKQ